MALKIFFGQVATNLIKDSGRDVQDVAEAIGKTPANQFSKWKNGQWTYIAEAKLLRIIDVIAGRDREKRTRLMIAYLIDMTPEVFRPLIDIDPISGEPGVGEPVGMKFPEAVREKLDEIGRAYSRDENFLKMADSMAGFARSINKKAETKKG